MCERCDCPGAHITSDGTAPARRSHAIIVGAGYFYAVRLVEALGLDPDRGVLRLSFVYYTSHAEIQHMRAALDEVL
jgi:selenocysteine lyase/cysteine desulfurase